MTHPYFFRLTTARFVLGSLLLSALLAGTRPAQAQSNDLLKELERPATTNGPVVPKTEYAQATFKSVRIVNGHSVETATKGTMHFLIGHRFGRLNEGAYNFFGLDGANIRLGLEYGITQNLTVGMGRSSQEKTYDGFVKYRVARQGEGPGTLPFTATALATSAVSTLKYTGQLLEDRALKSRLTYTYQLLLARKFSESFSLQLMPTLIHRNLVQMKKDRNNVPALGAAFRQKITKRLALTGEYYYVFGGQPNTGHRTYNSAALGFDLETGGHVFQLHFTNSKGMIEKFFIPQTDGDLGNGDIYFGFNISRAFTLGSH